MTAPQKPGQSLALTTTVGLPERSLSVSAGRDILYSAIALGDHAQATVIIQPPSGPTLGPLPIAYRLRGLPDPYTPPVEDLDAVRPTLLDTSGAAMGVFGKGRGLLGMGGIGKTVLAVALTHDLAVRQAFPAGVVWLSFGRDADIRARQDELVTALTGTPWTSKSSEEAHGLIDLLAQQLPERLLVVLDDVWEGPQTHAAFRDLPPKLQLLVTTRDRAVLERFGAAEHAVGLLKPDAALDFLAQSSGVNRAALPFDSGEILRRCGGLRLALAAVGALIRGGDYSWSDVRDALMEVRLEEFPDQWRLDRQVADLASVLKVSLDALTPEARERLNDFAAFQEDVAVPRDALLTLWSPTPGKMRQAKRTIGELSDRSILNGDAKEGYGVHDLYRDFLRDLLDDPRAQHRSLVARYEAVTPSGWALGPNDGYYFQALPWHLLQAGAPLDLLYDPSWLAAKLAATDLGQLIADCRLTPGDRQAERVGAALGLSAEPIRDNPADLLPQLCGRLRPTDGENIVRLLRRARAALGWAQMVPVQDGFLDTPGRLQRILSGHQGFINAIAVSGDGHRAVSGAEDRNLILWDLETGANLQTFRGHGGAVNGVCLLDARGVMVSGDDEGGVFFWSLDQSEPLAQLRTQDGSADIVVALADGWRVATAGSGGGVTLWDAAARACLGPLGGADGRVLSLAATPDGRLVSGDDAGKIVIWDVSGAMAPQVLAERGEPIRGLLITPDERVMAIAADGGVRTWSLAGAPPRGLGRVPLGHHAFAVTPELGLAVSGLRDGAFCLWRLSDGSVVDAVKAHGDQITVLAAAPGRPWLVSGSMDETLRVWDLAAPSQGQVAAPGILSLAVGPSGTLVLGGEDGEVRALAARGASERRIARHTQGVRALAILPDGATVVSASDDGAVVVADLLGGARQTLVPHHPRSISRVLALDAKNVLLLGGHGGLERLDLETGEVTASAVGHRNGVSCGVVLPSGEIATGGHDGDIRLWDLASGAVRRVLAGGAGPITAVEARFGGAQLFSVSGNGQVCLWDLVSGEKLSVQGQVDFARATGRGFQLAHGIVDACLLGDERFAVLCCGDKTIRVWDLALQTTARRFTDDHIAAACAFDARNNHLIVANHNGRVQIFDLTVCPPPPAG